MDSSWIIDAEAWSNFLKNQDAQYILDTSTEKKCKHKWKPTLLIFTTVFDCELCKMKQEDDK